ncbi:MULTISPECIES: hypothetical protein [Bradyrhizobium]|nr:MULTISPECIES: hypothetical protein [unclassified Bradyrhizobium]MDA9426502.1 hypothetical protein [Bradyrhizobium sp. CCBAU 53380]
MKRALMIIATAALASALAVGTAEAHGGGGGGHGGGGFGGGHMGFGGGHMGFGGGAHFGGMGHAGGFRSGARFGGEHLGFGDHVATGGLRQHAFHRYDRFRSGYGFYGYPDCYDWYELHPGRPLPLSCS